MLQITYSPVLLFLQTSLHILTSCLCHSSLQHLPKTGWFHNKNKTNQRFIFCIDAYYFSPLSWFIFTIDIWKDDIQIYWTPECRKIPNTPGAKLIHAALHIFTNWMLETRWVHVCTKWAVYINFVHGIDVFMAMIWHISQLKYLLWLMRFPTPNDRNEYK